VDALKAIEESSVLQMKKLEMKVCKAGVDVEIEVRLGDIYDEIMRAIAVARPDLVVMGTHGRRGVERWFMGSTAETLLRHTLVPVLTISAAGEKQVPRAQFRRILVTTDFSEGTADALAYAFSIAGENESRITLLHVLPAGTYRDSLIHGVEKKLDDLVPPEARPWCDVVTRVETGTPYQVILEMLEEENMDLLVMNIHGKGMMDRALLGSNAERVVRAASCPVMLVPPLTRRFKMRTGPEDRAA
jgi:nucleotide-binding universal stress UspA family protein